MELLIVRHAIAFESNTHKWENDTERPLSPLGIRRGRKAASGLSQLIPPPDRVLTSPLLRAKQTAQILSDVAGWPPAIELAALGPGTESATILRALERERCRSAAVVGHQPGLGHLLSVCLQGEPRALAIEMKKSAIACVSFKGAPRAGQGTLRWLATPGMLRAMRRKDK